MIVDEKATKAARKKQKDSRERLRASFMQAAPQLWWAWVERFNDAQTGRGKPVRLKPGVPPLRDAEHQRKHRKRKLTRASSRKNRVKR